MFKKNENKSADSRPAKTKDKSRMDDFSENVSVPLHLSLPLYIVGIHLLLVGVFACVGWAVFEYLASPEGKGFLISLKKEFGPLDSMKNVRWKFYIPESVFKESWIFGLKTFSAGLLLVILNRAGGTLWAKKRVEKTIAERRK